ncbi:hypothetical protein AB1285_25755 [Microbacterium sp. NRRL B-14842]|uniref:hypothetical protein n=1 Tax=Microbacterium sp. NRRL B-14842 TaxID=3162881 RepID=UPI003D28AF05
MKRVLASLTLAAVFGSALAAAVPSAAAAADDDALYLAPGGDDAASGTIDDPSRRWKAPATGSAR